MKKILFVDDDLNLLAGLQRQLRRDFDLETALGPEQGLTAIQTETYAVVIADMLMPGINGIEFLKKVKDRSPDTMRIMLTGNVDLPTAVRAVNEGNVFRLLTKPCPVEDLAQVLKLALRQFELVTAERVLLEKTLRGCVEVVTGMLAAAEPQTFGRAEAVRHHVSAIGQRLAIPRLWEVEMAAMLARIGVLTIPAEVSLKVCAGQTLTRAEHTLINRVPEVASKLLGSIPRVENIARIVLYQAKRFDGSGFPDDDVAGVAIPMGSRLLKILFDAQELFAEGRSASEVFREMKFRTGWYDFPMLTEVAEYFAEVEKHRKTFGDGVPVPLRELKDGQRLYENIETCDGVLILSAGHVVTEPLLERLRSYSLVAPIREPIYVCPEDPNTESAAAAA